MEYNLVLYQYKNKPLRITTSDDSKWDKLRKKSSTFEGIPWYQNSHDFSHVAEW